MTFTASTTYSIPSGVLKPIEAITVRGGYAGAAGTPGAFNVYLNLRVQGVGGNGGTGGSGGTVAYGMFNVPTGHTVVITVGGSGGGVSSISGVTLPYSKSGALGGGGGTGCSTYAGTSSTAGQPGGAPVHTLFSGVTVAGGGGGGGGGGCTGDQMYLANGAQGTTYSSNGSGGAGGVGGYGVVTRDGGYLNVINGGPGTGEPGVPGVVQLQFRREF